MPGQMAIRGILFDKDGTLLDFEATWGPLYRVLALDHAGGDAARAEAMLVAGGLDRATGRMKPGSVLAAGTTPEIVRLWYPQLKGEAARAMAARIDASFRGHGATNSVALPRMLETLATLAERGYVMGVATNDDTEAAKIALLNHGAGDYLLHVYGYDSVDVPKPAPDLVHAFARATDLQPAEIAVVGDNLHDLDMARAAGAGLAIGVLTGNAAREILEPHADAILQSIADLPEFLAEREGAQNRK
ncbi:MAG TPA: HAD family hydrolase [Bauldia sp.]|nr:HAD family hydrolase [Bauldia sp.]